VLFNSFSFIFAFLPLTLILFFILGKKNNYLAASGLAFASIIFYGYWNPTHVLILLASISFNFLVGTRIATRINLNQLKFAKIWLIFGIISNFLLLGYYKYTGFIFSNLNYLEIGHWHIVDIALPLGISFFTFTQIAFLVDAYKGYVQEYRPMHYLLFVTYFPHLLAGPVLHHKEMMPQFNTTKTYQLSYQNISVGLTLFFIGLFKKVILADGIATYVYAPFIATEQGELLPLLDAWGGALSYSLQLYFDFSAYSDMAVGLSLLFGVKLPLNFNSPYKATSIIDFWRRWHMTLSRFLRDYLYFPLGGNRLGHYRRYTNLIITMLLGGLWHGASWTFVIWGGLHGIFLLINHAWRENLMANKIKSYFPQSLRYLCALWLTFSMIVIVWVFFRASDLQSALTMLKGMSGLNGVVMPYKWLNKLGAIGTWLDARGVEFRYSPTFAGTEELVKIILGLLIVWCLPNSQQIMARVRPALNMVEISKEDQRYWHWQPSKIWLLISIIMTTVALLSLTEVSEFIYFQF